MLEARAVGRPPTRAVGRPPTGTVARPPSGAAALRPIVARPSEYSSARTGTAVIPPRASAPARSAQRCFARTARMLRGRSIVDAGVLAGGCPLDAGVMAGGHPLIESTITKHLPARASCAKRAKRAWPGAGP